jgi:plastocyanin
MMQGDRFAPAERAVAAGGSLTWVNLDREDHTVIAHDLSFEPPLIGPGQSWPFTFPNPGRHACVCGLHAGMEGVVIVTAGG